MKLSLYKTITVLALLSAIMIAPGPAQAEKATLNPITGKTVTAHYARIPNSQMIREKQLELAKKTLDAVKETFREREVKKACGASS